MRLLRVQKKGSENSSFLCEYQFMGNGKMFLKETARWGNEKFKMMGNYKLLLHKSSFHEQQQQHIERDLKFNWHRFYYARARDRHGKFHWDDFRGRQWLLIVISDSLIVIDLFIIYMNAVTSHIFFYVLNFLISHYSRKILTLARGIILYKF